MSEANELAEKLKSEGERFIAIFGGLTDDQWQREVYTEGATWTIRNVLAHFVTSERGLLRLFENIRQGGDGASADFSIDRYNASMQARTKDAAPQDLLEQYKAVRAESVAWTAALAEAELEKQGRHPFLGVTTLREMVKMLYIHNLTHYRDMKKALNVVARNPQGDEATL
ncbi:MAG: DinB family protein [Anaerolineales bacterium]